MAKIIIQGNPSGEGILTVQAPNTATDRTVTLPDSTGTLLDTTSSLDATKLTGNLPAISGASLTGLVSSLAAMTDTTVSASDPTVSSNPSATGHLWINKTSGESYVCSDATSNANVWKNIGPGTGDVEPVFAGSGGTTATYTYNSVDYKIHTFTSSSSFVVSGQNGTVDALVLAAGGGGGQSCGGGGGAGELVWNTGITANIGSITVTVGAGSAAADGSDSYFGALDANGGGRGGNHTEATRLGYTGGSSGGHARDAGSGSTVAVTKLSGGYGNVGGTQSNTGWANAAGGGGAGAVGGNGGSSNGAAGPGGAGHNAFINSSAETAALLTAASAGVGGYLAGGGGGSFSSGSGGAGGSGGGTAGVSSGASTAATANSGSGSGGSRDGTGTSGGSGLVIVRYTV